MAKMMHLGFYFTFTGSSFSFLVSCVLDCSLRSSKDQFAKLFNLSFYRRQKVQYQPINSCFALQIFL